MSNIIQGTARLFSPVMLWLIVSFWSLAFAAPQQGPRPTIAVSGFGLSSTFEETYGYTDASGGLSAMLTSELQKTGRFLVVERPALNEVFSEQELTAAGLVHDGSAALPGQLIGAQILVHGEITDFSQAESGDGGSIGFGSGDLGIGLAQSSSEGIVGIDIRLVDATTGQVLSTFDVRQKVQRQSVGLRALFRDISLSQQSFSDSPLGKAAREAIANIAERVVEDVANVAWEGRVIDVENGDIAINAGKLAGITVGQSFRIFRTTKTLRDPSTGRVLGERRRHIGEIVVEEVADELAFGRFISGESSIPENNDLVTL